MCFTGKLSAALDIDQLTSEATHTELEDIICVLLDQWYVCISTLPPSLLITKRSRLFPEHCHPPPFCNRGDQVFCRGRSRVSAP